ncbi:MAG: sigma factor-like helix-turn-helix DNA-binding protein [Patescibacteria group bacterium]
MAKNNNISFKPEAVTRLLLSSLPERARDIIKKRFGLEQEDRLTLDAIGKKYGITRERVRQIEDFSLKAIRRSGEFANAASVFAELHRVLEDYGGIVHEREFLKYLDDNEVNQNNFHFLLVLGNEFTKLKEDDEFHHRWSIDETLTERVHTALRRVAEELDENDLLSEEEMIKRMLDAIDERARDEALLNKARRWLYISKQLGLNPVGEWGLADSPNIRVRGVRDYAFLVLRREGSPMHFMEVAKTISGSFNRSANPATCHNELIKDKRFVLVGRGMYALTEWGYRPGIVREVVEGILKEHGPLTEEEVLARVLKERYVKSNTILINLKNPDYFKKDKQGRYLVA